MAQSNTPRQLASLAFQLIAGDDKKLSVQELLDALEGKSLLSVAKMFREADKDKNRYLTEDEYLNGIKEASSSDIYNASRGIASAAFRKIAGQDGKISLKELTHVLKGTSYEGDKFTIFFETETDRNRFITEEEFLTEIFKLYTSDFGAFWIDLVTGVKHSKHSSEPICYCLPSLTCQCKA